MIEHFPLSNASLGSALGATHLCAHQGSRAALATSRDGGEFIVLGLASHPQPDNRDESCYLACFIFFIWSETLSCNVAAPHLRWVFPP